MTGHGFGSPATVPLDEKVWQAWVAKNRESEKLDSLKRRTLAKLTGLILGAAGTFWLLLRLA